MTGAHFTRRMSSIVATLAVLVGGVISIAATPAFASPLPAPGIDGSHAQRPLRIMLVPGMRGWQIVLIALVVALVASVAAVAVDRARSARRPLAPQVS
jgi:hypothetical protein